MDPSADLNLLWTLQVLLEERNVTRAAERLNMTQSALSHRLRRLREMFDDPLFVTTNHGLTPTARAEALADPLSEALRKLRDALHAGESFDPSTTRRPLRLAAVDQAEVAYLAPIMESLHRVAPGVDVIVWSPGPDIYERLESGDVDLLFSPFVPDRAGLRQKLLLADEPAALVRADHPVVAEGLTLDRYCALPHIQVSPNRMRASVIDQKLQELGRARRVALQVPRFAGAAFMVAQTEMIMSVGSRFATAAAALLPLAVLPCPLQVDGPRVQMVWHERFDRDPAHQWFRKFMAEEIGEH